MQVTNPKRKKSLWPLKLLSQKNKLESTLTIIVESTMKISYYLIIKLFNILVQLYCKTCKNKYKYFIINLNNVALLFKLTSIASRRAPARRKKAAACSNLCLPRRAKAFFKAALRHRFSSKLLEKNCVIRSSLLDRNNAHTSDFFFMAR